MFNKREDAFINFVRQINVVRQEMGMPPMPIETIQEVFKRIPKDIRSKLGVEAGPLFKEYLAGFMNLTLELIGKQNQDFGKLAIEQSQWGVNDIKLKEAGKYAVKYLETALANVDELVAVLEAHGEEGAEDVRRILRRSAMYQILGDYHSKLPGAEENSRAIAAVQVKVPLLPVNTDNAENVIEGEVVVMDPRENGNGNGFVYQSSESHWFPNKARR